ncbi:MAG: hemolysin family protein [Candidatus Firestonebacteria bacterium]
MIRIALEITSLLLLFCLAAFFSGVETALISLSRSKTRLMMKEHPKKAVALRLWIDNPNQLLSTLLIGINVVAVASSTLSAFMAAEIAHKYGLNGALAGSISGILVAIIIIVFGEVTPKIFAIHNAEWVVRNTIVWLYRFDKIIYPVTLLSTKIGTAIIRLLGGKSSAGSTSVSRDEIRALVRLGNEEGVLKEDESQMLSNIFSISEKTVKDVMLPYDKFRAINIDDNLNTISSFVAEEGYTRMPVYKGTRNNIIGIIYTKELLTIWLNKKLFLISDLLRPLYKVKEERKAAEVLEELKKNKIHMAMVINKEDVIVGLVTLEDILEEIVGEMHDKFEKN